MMFDLIVFGCTGAVIVCIGVLIYWTTEDFGGRDD